MKLIPCNTTNVANYLDLIKHIYTGNPYYRDTKSMLIKDFITGRDPFAARAELFATLVVDDDQISAIAACIFIVAENAKDMLQMAFFEALPHAKEAVNMLVAHAKTLAKSLNIAKIIIGMDGHMNYGLGLLTNHFDSPLSFGNNYNPAYYIDYFKPLATRCHKMVSYRGKLSDFNLTKYQRVLDKIYRSYRFRTIDFKRFKDEIQRYTDLNNHIFTDHPLYFKREYDEDYALFKNLKLLMSPPQIIYAEQRGKVVGFLMWYPDFNQLVKPGCAPNALTVIKNKLFHSQIDTFKIVEIGLMPGHGGRGAIIGLFNECLKHTKERYTYYESSWIFEDNFRSNNLGIKWADATYKNYDVYEIDVTDHD